MLRKSVRSLFLTALLTTPFFSYATQYPLTVTARYYDDGIA
jgi:iron complex transport system substrate-binding protein